MSNWPKAVVFGLAFLGALQVLRLIVNVLFCHCGKLNVWCWYLMRKSSRGKRI